MTLRQRLGALAGALLLLACLRPGYPLDLNSDALYLDDLWLSLTKGAGWSQWYFPPAPSFFPDLPLLAACAPASDLGLRHGLYGLLLLALLALATAWLGRRRFGLGWGEALAAGLTGSLLLAGGLAFAPAIKDLLTPAHHGGALLGSLLLLALAPGPGPGQEAGPGERFAALVLTFLLSFSDRLFLLWGVFPLLLTQASQPSTFWRLDKLKWWAWVAGGWALAELGLARLRGLTPPTVARVRWDYWLEHRGGQELAKLGELGGLVLGAGALGLLALVWLSWRVWRLLAGSRDAGSWSGREALAWASLSAIASLLAALALGELLGRYTLPLFVLPALRLPLALPKARWLAGAAMGAALLAVLVHAGTGKLRGWSWDYPPEAVLLDASLAGRGLKVGVADYWQARRLRLLAHSHPQLLPIRVLGLEGRLAPYLWICDASVF